MLRGRRDECAALERLLNRIRLGESAVLVLRGEAGIGKTALIEFVAERATDCRVARAAGVQAEMELPFAGLHHLCAPMLDRMRTLPAPRVERRLFGGGEEDARGVEGTGAQHRPSAAASARSPRNAGVGANAVGERPVHVAPLGDGRGPVGGRAHQRMPAPHPRADLTQARRLGRPRRLWPDAEQLGRPPQQRHVADRLRRRRQHQPPGLRRRRLQPLEETGQRLLTGSPNPPATSRP
jgi:hypothetical protein